MENQSLHNPQLAGGPFLWEAGPTGILLLHGLTATTAEIRPLAHHLHQQSYTVAGPLLPGHGTAPQDLNHVRWRDWVWEAEQQYQHLATLCHHVFVGGESTGAVAALYLASRHPEIAGVLAYAPAIQLALPVSQLIRLYAAAPFVEFIPKKALDSNDKWQGYAVNPLKGVMELIRLGREARRRLSRIQQPVLVVQGRNDTTIDPASGEIICRGIGSKMIEQHWMENSGHIILLEDELDEIVTLTLQFMAQVLQNQSQ